MFHLHDTLLREAAFLAILLAATLYQTAGAAELKDFVTRRGDQLMVGDMPLRFISFNIPNLLVIEDAYSFTNPSPWRWPNEFEIADALESVRQMGGQVVRTYVISVKREGADMGDTVHVLAPGKFNEEGFRALDKVLQIANQKGVRVLIPLVDNWKWMGGVPQYAAFRGKSPEAFWSDPEIIADFKQTIDYVLNRKNFYTGVRYRDDPAVFGWETGNEIDATADWTRQIAAYIRQLDPNHLVVDGRSLHGVSQWQLDEPNTDVITTHHYPHGSPDFVPPIQAAHAQTKGQKPYVIGEFGFVLTPKIKAVLDTVVDDSIAGALIWSLRYHRREGGFYWHMEVGTGGNFYKAYHWPGFASGAAYDEQQVFALMREKGFEIQGLSPAPKLAPPAPPRLLPIESPAAISWQGAAGASSYDVLRALAQPEPWKTVAHNVTDADVQYRPLWHDDTAVPGQEYFYRVVARNAAGDSAPSNVVGPVTSRYRTFVDECRDLKRADQTQGDVTVRSDNVRRTQEDSHRLELGPGGAVVYRVDAPIRSWRVFAFTEKPDADLLVTASSDGTNFHPLEVKRRAFSSGQGDYGYLVPVLFEGTTPRGNPKYLRIESPAGADEKEPPQLSRVEIEISG